MRRRLKVTADETASSSPGVRAGGVAKKTPTKKTPAKKGKASAFSPEGEADSSVQGHILFEHCVS